MSGQAGDSKEEKLAAALFEAFDAHYPEDNLVEQNAYLPTTQLDGNFNFLEIAAHIIANRAFVD